MQYDAAIIGAGADGLAAASHLARAGLKVVAIERRDRAGGRLETRQFHPGYFASPFCDSIAAIPDTLLARLSAALRAASVAPDALDARQEAALTRAFADAAMARPRSFLARLEQAHAPPAPPWPGSDLALARLSDWPGEAPAGHALDPHLAGSAMALLALPRIESVSGGLGALGEAFLAEAQGAGAELRLGLEVSEVLVEKRRFGRARAAGVQLADGSRIESGAVISTLDLKQSLLGLFPWNVLSRDMVAAAGAFRMSGSTARLLLALKHPVGETALTLAGDDAARAAWRRGVVPDNPPLKFDPVSARDPGLAPAGGAVATVTLGAIPYRLFDGAWTHERRLTLAARSLARLSARLPGLVAALAAVEIIVPPDIETALGTTEGDLDGGALAPDQMLGLRPSLRTALPGFYLGGRSAGAGPLGTGAAGLAAAVAVLADAARPGWYSSWHSSWPSGWFA